MKKIEVYSTTVCPYCVNAKKLFKRLGYEYEEINLDSYPERMPEMLERSNGYRTVPQIFIGGEFVGGYDDVYAMEGTGELKKKIEG